MAIMSCPECGYETLSDKADACPYCGARVSKLFPDTNPTLKEPTDFEDDVSRIAVMIGVLAIMLIIVGVGVQFLDDVEYQGWILAICLVSALLLLAVLKIINLLQDIKMYMTYTAYLTKKQYKK